MKKPQIIIFSLLLTGILCSCGREQKSRLSIYDKNPPSTEFANWYSGIKTKDQDYFIYRLESQIGSRNGEIEALEEYIYVIDSLRQSTIQTNESMNQFITLTSLPILEEMGNAALTMKNVIIEEPEIGAANRVAQIKKIETVMVKIEKYKKFREYMEKNKQVK
jgi:hypothetical protein